MQVSDSAYLKRAGDGARVGGQVGQQEQADRNHTDLKALEAFDRAAEQIGRIPHLAGIELVTIALPMLLHVTLGIALATSAQAAEDPQGYARPQMLLAQRASGSFLVIYVVFHVLSTRLSPDRLAGGRDLFALMARQLEHPGGLAFHAAGVLAAAFHFGNGLVALAGLGG